MFVYPSPYILSCFPHPSWYLGFLWRVACFLLMSSMMLFFMCHSSSYTSLQFSYTRIVYAMLDAVILFRKVFERFDLLHCKNKWLPIAWLTYLSRNKKIRPWIPAFLTYILCFCREGGVYKRYFWASAPSETCAPGGSYFVYSMFLGVTLAWLMQSPESLFFDLQQLY